MEKICLIREVCGNRNIFVKNVKKYLENDSFISAKHGGTKFVEFVMKSDNPKRKVISFKKAVDIFNNL